MRVLGGIFLSFVLTLAAFAVPIAHFKDADTFLERGKDIVVAEHVSTPEQQIREGAHAAVVNVLKVLKGDAKPGRLRIATIYTMKPNTKYMLYNLGGNTLGTDFLALPELSVVPLPVSFKVDELKGKGLREQVQYMFSRRLYEVER
jgi:hypothetical protein